MNKFTEVDNEMPIIKISLFVNLANSVLPPYLFIEQNVIHIL